jgi:hypothetical protein
LPDFIGLVLRSRETGHLVFWRFHFYGKRVNQEFPVGAY